MSTYTDVKFGKSEGSLVVSSTDLSFNTSEKTLKISWPSIAKHQINPKSHAKSLLKVMMKNNKPARLFQMKDRQDLENISQEINNYCGRRIAASVASMDTSSKSTTITTANQYKVTYRSMPGTLYLSKNGLKFQATEDSKKTFSLNYSSIQKQQTSPPKVAKFMLKITKQEDKVITFQLATRAELDSLNNDIQKQRKSQKPQVQSTRTVQEDGSILFSQVTFKSTTGTLTLTPDQMEIQSTKTNKVIRWSRVTKAQGNPPSHAKVLLKVMLTDDNPLLFQLTDRSVMLQLKEDIATKVKAKAKTKGKGGLKLGDQLAGLTGSKKGTEEEDVITVQTKFNASASVTSNSPSRTVFEGVQQGGQTGKLILSPQDISFQTLKSTTRYPWSDIFKHQCSPPRIPKALMKLVLTNAEKPITFHLANRKDLNQIRREIALRLQEFAAGDNQSVDQSEKLEPIVEAAQAVVPATENGHDNNEEEAEKDGGEPSEVSAAQNGQHNQQQQEETEPAATAEGEEKRDKSQGASKSLPAENGHSEPEQDNSAAGEKEGNGESKPAEKEVKPQQDRATNETSSEQSSSLLSLLSAADESESDDEGPILPAVKNEARHIPADREQSEETPKKEPPEPGGGLLAQLAAIADEPESDTSEPTKQPADDGKDTATKATACAKHQAESDDTTTEPKRDIISELLAVASLGSSGSDEPGFMPAISGLLAVSSEPPKEVVHTKSPTKTSNTGNDVYDIFDDSFASLMSDAAFTAMDDDSDDDFSVVTHQTTLDEQPKAMTALPQNYQDVTFRSMKGTATLSKEHLLFQPDETLHSGGSPTKITWESVERHHGSPPKKPKAMLKVFLTTGKSVTLTLANREDLELIRMDMTSRLHEHKQTCFTSKALEGLDIGKGTHSAARASGYVPSYKSLPPGAKSSSAYHPVYFQQAEGSLFLSWDQLSFQPSGLGDIDNATTVFWDSVAGHDLSPDKPILIAKLTDGETLSFRFSSRKELGKCDKDTETRMRDYDQFESVSKDESESSADLEKQLSPKSQKKAQAAAPKADDDPYDKFIPASSLLDLSCSSFDDFEEPDELFATAPPPPPLPPPTGGAMPRSRASSDDSEASRSSSSSNSSSCSSSSDNSQASDTEQGGETKSPYEVRDHPEGGDEEQQP